MYVHKFNDLLSGLSKLAGLSEVAEKNFGGSSMALSLIDEETFGSGSLSQYFSYKYYDSETELFFNDENTVGFMLEVSPIVGVSNSLVKNLELFFNQDLPEDGFLQFLLVANHNINPILNLWKQARTNPDPFLQKITNAREEFLIKQSSHFKNVDGRLPRNFQIYISFSQKLENKLGSKVSLRRLKQVEQFKAQFLAKLNSFKLYSRVCGANDLISLTRDLVQMKETSLEMQKPKYDKYNLLSSQILKPLEKLTLTSDSIINDRGFVTKSYYVKEMPDQFSLSEMINLLGSETSGTNLGINARFAISYIIANNLNAPTQAALASKGDRIIHAAEQWYSRNDRDIKRDAVAWKEINDAHKNGTKFLTRTYQVMISARESEIDSAEQNLISLYNVCDWKLEENKYLQLTSLLSMLPMQQPLYFKVLKTFQLTTIEPSNRVVEKLPIHAEWKGVPKSGVLLTGRRGQLFNWNPFHRISSGNYNVCLMAASGGGKSVFLQELTTSMLAQNAKVFILDIGGSYANICELLGGEMIGFKNNANISLNPFSSLCLTGDHSEIDSEIEIQVIGKYKVVRDIIITAKSIIATMCGVASQPSKEALIEQAIYKGIEEYGPDLDITKLSKVLESFADKNKDAQELSTSLFSYTSSGVYGRYFSGSSNISFKKQLTVFEFEEIKNDSVFLSVIIQMVMMQIFLQVLCGDRKTPFLLVVDEAWKTISNSAKFLAELARTLRKYYGSLITCVQNFNDLQGSDDKRAILENSTWTLLLKQDEKGLSSFKNSEAFKDILPLIESISLAPGKYAEILFHATDIAVVGRLGLDPYSQSLFSTDAVDFRYLIEAKERGLSQDEAVESLAREKYGYTGK